MRAMREVEFKGHLIDSLIFPKVLSKIMDLDGEFDILKFDVGKRKIDPSYARIAVYARNEEQLEQILTELHTLGACLPEIEDAHLVPAEADRVAPRGFYSTTNHATHVRVKGKWMPVEHIGMDRLVVVKNSRAVCTPLSKIKKGDSVVVGDSGVRVKMPERPRGYSLFEFMGGGVSSERPSLNMIKQIAAAIVETRKRGGRIAVVGGPAIVHTGAAPALAEIIRLGYVDVLLAGNALAVHDIEYNLYGTSLGMSVETGRPVSGGHRHHLYAIREITAAGGIRNAVETGIVNGGIMYECVKNNIKYVLAGSIRDDGPLPDVISDTVAAKEEMLAALADVELVLMLATMLHSIATGNLLPSTVKTICADINPQAVTKLTDRGSAQAIGLITDVGTFLPALAEEIKSLTSS
ncbi:MAG TPA: TIGR00300 family protein [Candidatus Methanoperedenaceae archaeon]|nr:TIGR00300 family protein [Candidatus Methanoperedenaceae archaeon]